MKTHLIVEFQRSDIASRWRGDIDPKKSLLIGDLGPDRLIALDYRGNESPRVLYLVGETESLWILAAQNLQVLAENFQS